MQETISPSPFEYYQEAYALLNELRRDYSDNGELGKKFNELLKKSKETEKINLKEIVNKIQLYKNQYEHFKVPNKKNKENTNLSKTIECYVFQIEFYEFYCGYIEVWYTLSRKIPLIGKGNKTAFRNICERYKSSFTIPSKAVRKQSQKIKDILLQQDSLEAYERKSSRLNLINKLHILCEQRRKLCQDGITVCTEINSLLLFRENKEINSDPEREEQSKKKENESMSFRQKLNEYVSKHPIVRYIIGIFDVLLFLLELLVGGLQNTEKFLAYIKKLLN